jgi:hypothetical protein
MITLLLLLSVTAQAEDGTEVIALMDDAMNRAKDQTIGWAVHNKEPGKDQPSKMAFTVQVQGTKNLTHFTDPADLNGTRVLTMSRTQMYIFMPQYNKVRRIASHVTQQGFMGTTYSYDDMNGAAFGDVYTAELTDQDETSWTVALTTKGEAPYAKAQVKVSKEYHHPLELKYFNDKEAHVKTEVRTGYECQSNVCLAKTMKMEDHTRNGAWTELRRETWELNTGLDADVFSVRNLQRGE